MSEARSVSELDPTPELTKYELVQEVGHGGMATVYRALDPRLGREVAIKVIHRHLRDNPEVATRFTAEARAVAKLRHPNIVEVYDVSDEADRERFLVVELVRGTTLRKLLARRGHLPAEIAAAIGLGVADALQHAHQQGVIHRDVKPENVLVADPLDEHSDRPSNPESLVKITDFGIAKILDAQGVTSTGQVLGSPAHMSPEQIEGGEISPRSDVFGLGVLLYECMVGELPFDGRNPAQVLRRVLDGTYTQAERARATVGNRFSRILDRALAHAASDRYSSADELARDLALELGRLGFTEPFRELEEYLRDPTGYQEAYPARMVERLAELGRKAQATRDSVEAAHCFNRALAFRPDDPELIRLVTGLSRAERLRTGARRLGAGALAALIVGLGTYALASAYYGGQHTSRPALERKFEPMLRLPQVMAQAEPMPANSVTLTRANVSAPPRVAPSHAPKLTEQKLRTVLFLIPGASGGRVTVDGEDIGGHGAKKDLVVGQTYTVGFVPPNKECCIGSQQTLVVRDGEGILSVSGTISLRSAIIKASGAPEGSRLSCVGWGETNSTSLTVELQDPEETSTCRVTPPVETGIPFRSRQVKIRAGETIDLWP